MNLTEWGLISLIILASAFIMTIAGFGYALVASPFLLLLLEPKTVIVYNNFLGLIIALPIIWHCWRFARLKQLVPIVISCLFGLPLGIYILSQLISPVLKIIMAALVVVFALLLALGYSYKFRNEGLGSAISGFIGGTLMTSTSIGGPPVILFLLNQGCDKDSFRANMIIYLCFAGIGALVALGISGVVTGSILVSSLSFVPALAAGFYSGTKVLPYMNSALFRKIAVAIVLIMGVVGVVTGILALR